MRAALEDGGVQPDEIDYINAHGTGTAVNDPNEIAAVCSVLGPQAANVAVSSTKAVHGHAIGAAGALEAAATALAVHHQFVPPTANLDQPDPAITVDVVPNQGRETKVRCALSHSFAFGGLNAVLALRRTQSDLP